MADIRKSYAYSVAILAVVSFLLGFAVAISSWILNSKTKDIRITEGDVSQTTPHETDIVVFNSYWWGGFFYLIPGLLGILAGCTRKFIVMVFFSVFNIICMIASSVACILVGLMFSFWLVINSSLQEKNCEDIKDFCICRSGNSTVGNGKTYSIANAECSSLDEVNNIMLIIIVSASISTFIAVLTSIISCCSLFQKEDHDSIAVSYQTGYGGTSIRRGTYQHL